MAFLKPFTHCGPYYYVDTLLGCFIVPADDIGPDATAIELAQYAPEYVGREALDQQEDWEVELRTGWYGRLSAPGYLDCTEWEWADTEAELIASLTDGDDDCSEDDDSEDDPDDESDESEDDPDREIEVLCGNIGTVYRGHDQAEADRAFDHYVAQSQIHGFRASNESVTMFLAGEIAREHIGSNDDDPDDGPVAGPSAGPSGWESV